MRAEQKPTQVVDEIVTLRTEKAVGIKRPDWPYIGLEHIASGTSALLGTAHSGVSTGINSIFRKGDVLFGKLRPNLRKTFHSGFDGYCSTDILVLEPVENMCPGFVGRVFQTNAVFAVALATSVGTRMPRTSWHDLRSVEVFVPSLAEQQRIAEVLDTVDKAIQDTEKLVSKLQRMKQGLVHDLLTWGVDAHGTLRDPERHPEHFKDSPTGRYPRDWQLRPLRDLAQVRSGIAKNTNRVLGRSKLVPYLSVANVQDGYLDLANVSQIRIGADEMERFALRYGDVLMNEGGDLDKLGRGAVWRAQIPGCVHQNHVFSVRCGPGLLPEFLDLWTGSSPARRYFMVEGKQTTNLASINKTALEGLPVAHPPFDEQVAIVAAVNAADEQLAQESHALAKLRALKQGLMEDLLTGRVRVSAAGAGAP